MICPRCKGVGRLYPPDPIGDEVGEPCPQCREDGWLDDEGDGDWLVEYEGREQ